MSEPLFNASSSTIVDWQEDDGMDLLDVVTVLVARWRLLIAAPALAGALALGVTFLIAPTYTAKTTFLPPQQQQSAATAALSSLGALSGLAGGIAGIKSPGDQYVALLQSVNIEDRIIDQFKLMEVYEAKYRSLARKDLEANVRISLGKKDGLITVEADAKDPTLAAAMANAHVTELRRLSGELALTEAQQRRVFFERQVKLSHDALTQAQQTLQTSGFNPSALKAEPKAAADTYAKVKAQTTSVELRLVALRRSMTDTSPEIQQELALLGALRAQLAQIQSTADTSGDADYISRYREFKYQETLFDLFSKQYELAKVDESREGALIQVIDVATPPDRKSRPKRTIITLGAGMLTFVLLSVAVLVRYSWRPGTTERLARLRASLASR